LKILDERTTAMTIEECAELLKAHKPTLYKHAKTGKLRTFRVARMIRVNPADLADQIRRGSNNPLNSDDRRRDDVG
jgi:excisionase family DNA binding protein